MKKYVVVVNYLLEGIAEVEEVTVIASTTEEACNIGECRVLSRHVDSSIESSTAVHVGYVR